jgi:bifunctional DNA-binding transcriptional regulator/antitoxin component of YhaV-PrlF toxin-antitoxin module
VRFQTKIISGGRLTIPEATRQALKLEEGDIVDVELVKVESRPCDQREA